MDELYMLKESRTFDKELTIAVEKIMAKQESIIRQALDNHFPNGWSFDSVKDRLSMISYIGSKSNNYIIDDRLILIMTDPDFRGEGEAYFEYKIINDE